jgi:hypothetical protein
MKVTEKILRRLIRESISTHTRLREVDEMSGPEGGGGAESKPLTMKEKIIKFQKLIGLGEAATGNWKDDGTDEYWVKYLSTKNTELEDNMNWTETGIDLEKAGTDWGENHGKYSPNIDGIIQFVEDLEVANIAAIAKKLADEEAARATKTLVNGVKFFTDRLPNLNEKYLVKGSVQIGRIKLDPNPHKTTWAPLKSAKAPLRTTKRLGLMPYFKTTEGFVMQLSIGPDVATIGKQKADLFVKIRSGTFIDEQKNKTIAKSDYAGQELRVSQLISDLADKDVVIIDHEGRSSLASEFSITGKGLAFLAIRAYQKAMKAEWRSWSTELSEDKNT